MYLFRNQGILNIIVFTIPHFWYWLRPITWQCLHLSYLLVWSLLSHSRIFHSYGDVTITGEGLQIWTYARHSWPLSSVGSLACHTYCDTKHPFIMVISEDPWHSHLVQSLAVELSLPICTTKICHGLDSNTQPSTCRDNPLTHCATATVLIE